MYEDIKIKDGEGVYSSSLSKNEVIKWLSKTNYANIIYLCCDKGYVYRKELDNLLLIDSRHYIKHLKYNGIIEEFTLDVKSKENLKIIKGLNDKNMYFLSTYRLTTEVKILLQNPFIYDLMCENSSGSVKKYKDYLIDIYNKKISEIEFKKQLEKEKILTRYNIAKQKNIKLRTGDDIALIQMIERGNL